MRNLLIIAYYFPPSGGAGVQRVLKHIQYLPQFGWNPIVLTVSNGDFPARDESLLAKIPPGIHVERVRIFEPYNLFRAFTGKAKGSAVDVNTVNKEGGKRGWKDTLAEWIRATFFIPDARIGWLLTGTPAAKELCEKYDIDVVYSSSPPYTTSLIARRLKRWSGKKWVAGFRDPWTGFISTPKRWFLPAAIDRYLEHSVFREADAVECAWPGIIKDIRGKFPNLPAQKFHYIPNGFDSSDFPQVEAAPNSRFTVTYTGTMYGRRDPSSFLSAIQKLVDAGKLNPDKLLLRFVGRFGNEAQAIFAAFPYPQALEIIGYVPHSESIAYLMRSDALLLIVDEARDSAEIVPGKVFEYMGVYKPLIAIAPEQSAIADILRETGAGTVAHQSRIGQIAENIHILYRRWQAGEPTGTANPQALARYERREAARMLAALLDSL